jgi:hypothetical protein
MEEDDEKEERREKCCYSPCSEELVFSYIIKIPSSVDLPFCANGLFAVQ